ncbi:hypothetical protein OS176_01260 [Xanthomonadaceae bacterium XH05]|nr:hypothetical protein [Xanthomonadaceae bacterium XH05]
MRKAGIVLAVIAAAVLAWLWFGRGGDTAIGHDDPLAFAPADTPYVFGNITPPPAEAMKRYLAHMDPQITNWRQQIGRVLTGLDALDDDTTRPEVEASDASGEIDVEPAMDAATAQRARAWLRAIDAELAAAPDGAALMARLGFHPDHARMAIYGIGLVPVSRTVLADPAAFRALVDRLQRATGESFEPLQLEGVDSGWRIAAPDVPVQGIVAIVGNHLVVTVAPADSESALRTLLGLERPMRSLADGGELQTLNQAEGFTPFGSGYLDVRRLLAQFQTPATELESAFLAPLGIEKPNFPSDCDTGLSTLSEAIPRLIVGYTRMDADGIEALSRIDTSAAIATHLQSLRVPMPGLQVKDDALGLFGMAMKVSALPSLANALDAATRKQPWSCEALTALNELSTATRNGLSNPAVYAAGPMFNSMLLALDRIELDSTEWELRDLAARLVIGSDNPAGLIATARSFVPQLAGLSLQPDSRPQRLPTEALDEFIKQPAFVALAPNALGIAIGADQEARLPAYLQSTGDAQPLLYVRYRGALISEVARLMREASTDLPDAEREELVINADLLEEIYARHIDWLEMTVEFTAKGIEFRQRMALVR